LEETKQTIESFVCYESKGLELRDQLQREAGSNVPVLVSDLPRQQTPAEPRQSSPATAKETGKKWTRKSKADSTASVRETPPLPHQASPTPGQAPPTRRPAPPTPRPASPSPLRQHQRVTTIYSQPPKPNEGTWLVYRFLNHFLDDDGGRLLTGNAEKFPEFDSENVRIQLKNFLAQPEFSQYHYRQKWHEILDDNDQVTTNTIRANVAFCREVLDTRPVKKHY
jgi:hypothetical protein